MTDLWSFLLQTLTASSTAVLLLAVKAIFRDKLSPRWQFAVWGILGLVLLAPAGWRGRFALVNWPYYVELLRSSVTGEYGALARVVAPVPVPSLTAPQSAADWVFLVYLAGVVVFLLRYVFAYVRLRRALKSAPPADMEPIRAAAERYGLPVCPAVRVEGLPSAFVCGVCKPILAVPGDVDEKILLHELLHYKHHDAVWGLVICFFRCIHWCNPFLWLCFDWGQNDLEALCDQRALEHLEGEERREYGRILLSMAGGGYARFPGTTSLANGTRNIRRRIKAIVRFRPYPKGMAVVSVCLMVLMAVLLLAGQTAALDLPIHTGEGPIPQAMAQARTTHCTTYAGAFDTYAKFILLKGQVPKAALVYRAMCAPLDQQEDIAARFPETENPDFYDSLDIVMDSSYGYQLYGLQEAEDGYEGILLFRQELYRDSSNRYLTQRVQARQEQGRWIIDPLEPFQALDPALLEDSPVLRVYEDQSGDFRIQLRWQEALWVDSSAPNTGMLLFDSMDYDYTPVPNGTFASHPAAYCLAYYTGAPERKADDHIFYVGCHPDWDDNSIGAFTTFPEAGEFTQSLDEGWESPLVLHGGVPSNLPFPDRYTGRYILNDDGISHWFTLLPTDERSDTP